MAKNKKNDLASLSIKELEEKSLTLGREIFELKNQLSIQRRLEKPHMLKAAKKQRARVLTMITQKQKEGTAA